MTVAERRTVPLKDIVAEENFFAFRLCLLNKATTGEILQTAPNASIAH